jgi:hypothetical protein
VRHVGGVCNGADQLAASTERAEAPIMIPIARVAKIKYFFIRFVLIIIIL